MAAGIAGVYAAIVSNINGRTMIRPANEQWLTGIASASRMWQRKPNRCIAL
jgi:hypothetical protein